MSTDPPRSAPAATRRTRNRRKRARAFAAAFAVVVGALLVVGVAGGAASVAQGPRVTNVQVDPAAAAAASGSRVILTTTQSLAKVDPSQVTVTPETPFAIATSGRSVGVRFVLPLWDDTRYTVTIKGVTGVGGGPSATLTESFRTPAATVYLLQRSAGGDGDRIMRTALNGKDAEPVFTHPHIEDFRATGSHLVISVRTDDDKAQLIVTDLSGRHARDLTLPGDGFISQLQSADRGELVGYTFSDADLDATGGLESALFTASLKDAAAKDKPAQVRVGGADPRVAEWRFVPDTDSLLLLSFDGSLLLTGSNGADPTALGNAIAIDGIARGSSQAVVARTEQMSVIDLTDASESELVAPQTDIGTLRSVTPLPNGQTVRTSGPLGDDGFPTGETLVTLVGTEGATRTLFDSPANDGVLQTCVSPSARYVAVLVAPDVVSNPYDTYLLPLPKRLETHILRLDDGTEVSTLAGSSISWCQVPPS
jgi:hypothetical protein